MQEKNIEEHINDVKYVVIHIAVAFVVAFSLSLYKVSSIFNFIINKMLPQGYNLNYFTMESMFFTNIRIAFFASLILAFPFILWRLAIYLRCLANSSIVSISVLSAISGVLFAIGIWCGVYYVVPKFVVFMLNMAYRAVDVELNISSFINTVMFLNIVVGLVFQLPVLFFMLIKNGIINANFMEKNRKWYVILSFVLGAVLTPPDVFSQIVVSLFFITVFEISLIFAKIFKKNS